MLLLRCICVPKHLKMKWLLKECQLQEPIFREESMTKSKHLKDQCHSTPTKIQVKETVMKEKYIRMPFCSLSLSIKRTPFWSPLALYSRRLQSLQIPQTFHRSDADFTSHPEMLSDELATSLEAPFQQAKLHDMPQATKAKDGCFLTKKHSCHFETCFFSVSSLCSSTTCHVKTCFFHQQGTSGWLKGWWALKSPKESQTVCALAH